MKWPADGVIRIKSLAINRESTYRGLIEDVKILGYDGDVQTVRSRDHLTVIAPKLSSEYPVCIKVKLG